jgi:hypothetical protein
MACRSSQARALSPTLPLNWGVHNGISPPGPFWTGYSAFGRADPGNLLLPYTYS